MKSGFISLIGKPNVGKSSLMNALIGEKVSIVSPKAQTTRDRILGILTEGESQMVFIDTPGVHKATTRLGKYMSDCVKSGVSGADIIVVVFDATKNLTTSDLEFAEKYLRSEAKVFIAINKTDRAGFERVYPMLERMKYLSSADGDRKAAADIIPTSAKSGKNVDVLKSALLSVLPDGPFYYPADELTDKSERFMIAEIVREKALLFLDDEIPHGVGVEVRTMFYDERKVAHIAIDIIVEKASHKPMVIGKGGEKLKTIVESARRDVEKLLDSKVFMETFVKVRTDWRNDALVLGDVGYDPKKID